MPVIEHRLMLARIDLETKFRSSRETSRRPFIQSEDTDNLTKVEETRIHDISIRIDGFCVAIVYNTTRLRSSE